MSERRVAVGELQANLSRCLDEVRGGTTLLVTDGGERVARLIPEPEAVKQGTGSLGRRWDRREWAAAEETNAVGTTTWQREHE